jgi:hypothetical protein
VIDTAAQVDLALDSRAASFENPRGERGAGGRAAQGRKGAPRRIVLPGERVVMAELDGPGRVRHLWLTVSEAAPQALRALVLEVFYDDRPQPSISVPCLDFFGLPHGRPVAYESALTSVQEALGFNAYFPMPFARRVRFEFVNHSPRWTALYYQIDYTREALRPGEGYLHASFRRENPTRLKQDFVIVDGLRGPGRFLGAVIGVRVHDDGMHWFGEGELKIYRDGDGPWPTICGTGFEDYIGTAWGMGAHAHAYAGAPLVLAPPQRRSSRAAMGMPDFVGAYRWHLPDPVVFASSLTVTLQQIGALAIGHGPNARARYDAAVVAAGGWELGPAVETVPEPLRAHAATLFAYGLAERRDDCCATAFVYCREPQPVAPVDVAAAVADLELRAYERPDGALAEPVAANGSSA